MNFTKISTKLSIWIGRPKAFLIAIGVCILWAVSGPFLHYSDTWQLIINTGTTVLSFLMMFLIANTQNRNDAAVNVKLDEILRALDTARNSVIGLEDKAEEEIEEAKREIKQAVATADQSPSN